LETTDINLDDIPVTHFGQIIHVWLNHKSNIYAVQYYLTATSRPSSG